MAEGESSRRWAAGRREIKRAEVRLSHGLRNLEEARNSYLNSMTKEQKRLKQELLRLQKCRSKQKLSVNTTARIGIKFRLPQLSHQAGQDHSGASIAAQRHMSKTSPKAGELSERSKTPVCQQTHSSDAAACEGDGTGWLPSISKTPTTTEDNDVIALKHAITKQLSLSASSAKQEESDETQVHGQETTSEEAGDARATGTTSKPVTLPGKQRPSLGHERVILDADAYGADGRLRTMYSRPDFLKSYAEVKKARYLRHKHTPAWEKELSLQEIFGHRKPADHFPAERQ